MAELNADSSNMGKQNDEIPKEVDEEASKFTYDSNANADNAPTLLEQNVFEMNRDDFDERKGCIDCYNCKNAEDKDKFMIACDSCDNWFHGVCIDVEWKVAINIKTFYCSWCREKNAQLQNELFKFENNSEIAKSKLISPCGECVACCRKEDCGRCYFCNNVFRFSVTSKMEGKCRNRKCLNPRKAKISYDTILIGSPENELEDEDDLKDKDYWPTLNEQVRSRCAESISRKKKNKKKNTKRRCHGPSCEFSARTGSRYCSESCSFRRKTKRLHSSQHRRNAAQTVAKDPNHFNDKKSNYFKKARFSSGVIKRKIDCKSCKYSEDRNRFMIACDRCDRWYHGECVNVAEETINDIKKYYCWLCRRKKIEIDDSSKVSTIKLIEECRKCEACCRQKDCGHCAFCKYVLKYGIPSKIEGKCSYRECMNIRISKIPEKCEISERKNKINIKRKNATMTKNHRSPFKKATSVPEIKPNVPCLRHKSVPRQCYGPGCQYSTRAGSKYCSDFCGINLAMKRIKIIIPERIQKRNSLLPCVADENNILGLERNREQQGKVREALAELHQKKQKLLKVIERARQTPISKEIVQLDECELVMYCITCGFDIIVKTAVRHMEKCFIKYERKVSYESMYKSAIKNENVVCDFHNPLTKTYCKRLRVICPEHSKQTKISKSQGCCGGPMVAQVLDYKGPFCRSAKKNCVKHHSWEKLWRAELDVIQVHYVQKLHGLEEDERSIRMELIRRGNVIDLIHTETTNE